MLLRMLRLLLVHRMVLHSLDWTHSWLSHSLNGRWMVWWAVGRLINAWYWIVHVGVHAHERRHVQGLAVGPVLGVWHPVERRRCATAGRLLGRLVLHELWSAWWAESSLLVHVEVADLLLHLVERNHSRLSVGRDWLGSAWHRTWTTGSHYLLTMVNHHRVLRRIHIVTWLWTVWLRWLLLHHMRLGMLVALRAHLRHMNGRKIVARGSFVLVQQNGIGKV